MKHQGARLSFLAEIVGAVAYIHIPKFDSPVGRSARKPVTVGSQRDCGHHGALTKDLSHGAGVNIPKFRGAIGAAGSDPFLIVAKADSADAARVASQNGVALPGVCVPDFDAPIFSPGGQPFSARTQGHRPYPRTGTNVERVPRRAKP